MAINSQTLAELKRQLEGGDSLQISSAERSNWTKRITPLLRTDDEELLELASEVISLLAQPVSCKELTITLQELTLVILPISFEEAGTGHFLWTAGLLLASYLVHHPEVVKSRTVLLR